MGKEKFECYHKGRFAEFVAAEIMSTPYLLDGRYTVDGPGTLHMILTHIVQKDEQYAKFYKQADGLKLLDNSLFELGYALSPKEVLEAAAVVDADIIVSPDVIRDGEATVQNAINFIEQLRQERQLGKYAIMAVPQGNSVEEWLDCYNKLVAMPEIDCIGLSIIGMVTSMQDTTGTEDITVNREAFMKKLHMEGSFAPEKWHHLLGLGRGPFELLSYTHMPWVRSNDSSNAWWHGRNGIEYEKIGQLQEKLKLEVDFASPVSQGVHEYVQGNLLEQRAIVNQINKERKKVLNQMAEGFK